MSERSSLSWTLAGALVAAGLMGLGWQVSQAALKIKQLDRSVRVKGLAEREVPADVVIWPIEFQVADNDLTQLYKKIESHTQKTTSFLRERGIAGEEISTWPPQITDKAAERFGGGPAPAYRYVASQSLTVYSKNIKQVREAMKGLSELGKSGIALSGHSHLGEVEYLFTKLNEIKPAMIEDATKKAREVAEKFASDSHSQLGKIKNASQGQFSIRSRDSSSPHIKKIRVVSTVSYFLDD